jgi:hypothetical protein
VDSTKQHEDRPLRSLYQRQVQKLSFDQLCTDKVSGGNGGELCLIAVLGLAFDH